MEPDGGLNPLLLARRAAILDKYEGLKTNYPELPSNLRDYQVSCSQIFADDGRCLTHAAW